MEMAARVTEWASKFLQAAAKTRVYRELHRIPAPVKGQNRLKLETAVLWPVLVEIWHDRHGKPAAPGEGPFFRFVQFVHELAGLPEAKQGTLNSALARQALSTNRFNARLKHLARLYNRNSGSD